MDSDSHVRMANLGRGPIIVFQRVWQSRLAMYQLTVTIEVDSLNWKIDQKRKEKKSEDMQCLWH